MSRFRPKFLEHKKFQVGIITSLAVFFAQFSAALGTAPTWQAALLMIDWVEVMAPILTAIGAQGIADFGKEAAKVKG